MPSLPNSWILETSHTAYVLGLDPAANYRIDEQSGVRSGLAWMQIGINLYLADFQSAMMRIWRE